MKNFFLRPKVLVKIESFNFEKLIDKFFEFSKLTYTKLSLLSFVTTNDSINHSRLGASTVGRLS
jgi:hypothetical protein